MQENQNVNIEPANGQPAQPAQPVQPAQPAQPVQPAQPAQPVQPGFPTIEQSNADFVNNTQIASAEKVEEKKGKSFGLIIILFIIVLVAIIFLFPIFKKFI